MKGSIVLCLAVCAVCGWWLAPRGNARVQTAQRAPSAEAAGRVAGVAIAVPGDWTPGTSGRTSASWTAPDGRRTLLLGVVPMSPVPLESLAQEAARSIVTATGTSASPRIDTRTVGSGETVVVSRVLLASPARPRVLLVQVWRRFPQHGVDAIATAAVVAPPVTREASEVSQNAMESASGVSVPQWVG